MKQINLPSTRDIILSMSLGIAVLTQSFTCNKDEEDLPATTIEISVKDGNSWSESTPVLSAAAGATIYLYATEEDVNKNTPQYTATTDQAGIAKIHVTYQDEYFIKAQKGNAKNMVNGLLITGIFQSQAEIEASAIQLGAKPGSPKLLDANADGNVNSWDTISADRVEPKQDQNVQKTVIIYQ